ncbi:MAG: phosphate signaling complex protein PhoU [Anaerolineales bacterium]|nr:phosphate signaling complex protein PhoU [Anaerolineales bacterium]
MESSLRARYDRTFSGIVDAILKMGSMIEEAVQNAINSLQNRDTALAQEVVERDAEVNALRFEIEEACLALIATQQPAAGDLRAVIAAMNIVVDLERMGDHASGIAKTVIRMGDQPLLKPLIDIPRMAKLAVEMLRGSLKAFVDVDPEAAQAIAPRDEEMDFLYRAIFEELVEIMARNPQGVERATYLLWTAHNLERIGDRVTNIAERVVFMSTGDVEELNV